MVHDRESNEHEARIRELFDTSNRVMFARYLQEHALDEGIALNSTERVREVYFAEAEKHWDVFRREAATRTPEDVERTLAILKEEEARLPEPRTLRDVLAWPASAVRGHRSHPRSPSPRKPRRPAASSMRSNAGGRRRAGRAATDATTSPSGDPG